MKNRCYGMRSIILVLFCLLNFSNSYTATAQVYFDSVYQDYIYVYKKVREFDMSFTEAMPITASKTFILENEHIAPAIRDYKKKYPYYNEQDILVELTADVCVKFLNEQVQTLECKKEEKAYTQAYSGYICNCAEQKAKTMPGYKWATEIDSVMKGCATSFISSIEDEQLLAKMNKLIATEKTEVQECAKIYSYINCERLTIDLIGACINRAERYYYFEKGLRMKKEVGRINKFAKEGQLLPSEVYLKGQKLTDDYSLLLLEAKEYLEEENSQTYEVQDWDKIYSIWYKERKGAVNILFGISYQFSFDKGAAKLNDISYMTLEEMQQVSVVNENIQRLLAEPILGGSDK